jgi:hypothetical protein
MSLVAQSEKYEFNSPWSPPANRKVGKCNLLDLTVLFPTVKASLCDGELENFAVSV